MAKLLYVGQQVADELSENVAANLERYRNGGFHDMESAGDWRVPLSVEFELEELKKLRSGKSADDEIYNSLLVGHALRMLTPTLARENRVWIRLSHVECIDYARKRWLSVDASDSRLERDVRIHMFASTLTRCRDDHAISRLWWNHRIAVQMIPENPARALKMTLARADIRQSLVERPGVGARPALGRGIIRALEENRDLLRRELLFREFMKRVNLLGAGIAFEVWSEEAVDRFMQGCVEQASNASLAPTGDA